MEVKTQFQEALRVIQSDGGKIPDFLKTQDPEFYQKATQPGADLKECLKQTSWCLLLCDSCGGKFRKIVEVVDNMVHITYMCSECLFRAYEMINDSRINEHLKLFIYDNFSPNYYYGLAFAIAANEEEAKYIIAGDYVDSFEWGDVTIKEISEKEGRCITGGC
jgi:hypothetical protein